MRWVKSTTQKAWTVGYDGKAYIIPQCNTPDNKYLQLDDSVWSGIAAMPVIASLIRVNGILVLNEEPVELKNSVDALQGSNAKLVAEKTQLEADIARLTDRVKELESSTQSVDVEAIKAEAVKEVTEQAVKELQEKQDEIDRLTKELAKVQGKSKKGSSDSE